MLIFKELLYIELYLVKQTVFNLYLNQNRFYKQQKSVLSPSQYQNGLVERMNHKRQII